MTSGWAECDLMVASAHPSKFDIILKGGYGYGTHTMRVQGWRCPMLGWVLQAVGFVLMVPGFRRAKRWTPFWLYATSVAVGFVLFFVGGFFQSDEVIIRQHWAMVSGLGIMLALGLMLAYFRREKQRDRDVELEEVTEDV